LPGPPGKQPCHLRFRESRALEGIEKSLPWFRGSNELTLVGENVLGLQTGALENEIGQADAGGLGARANESFLAVRGAYIDAPVPNRSRAKDEVIPAWSFRVIWAERTSPNFSGVTASKSGQTGSHLRLTSRFKGSEHHVTIPSHDALKVGTLSAILADAAAYLEIDRAALVQDLFQG
jgi:hypothetical protein